MGIYENHRKYYYKNIDKIKSYQKEYQKKNGRKYYENRKKSESVPIIISKKKVIITFN